MSGSTLYNTCFVVCCGLHNANTQSPIPSSGTSSGIQSCISCVGVDISVAVVASLGVLYMSVCACFGTVLFIHLLQTRTCNHGECEIIILRRKISPQGQKNIKLMLEDLMTITTNNYCTNHQYYCE